MLCNYLDCLPFPLSSCPIILDCYSLKIKALFLFSESIESLNMGALNGHTQTSLFEPFWWTLCLLLVFLSLVLLKFESSSESPGVLVQIQCLLGPIHRISDLLVGWARKFTFLMGFQIMLIRLLFLGIILRTAALVGVLPWRFSFSLELPFFLQICWGLITQIHFLISFFFNEKKHFESGTWTIDCEKRTWDWNYSLAEASFIFLVHVYVLDIEIFRYVTI